MLLNDHGPATEWPGVRTREEGYLETPLGLSVVDPATGHLLAHLDTDARSFSLSDSGNAVAGVQDRIAIILKIE